jgi:tetratricopeptide (TPR) repeat protein
MRVLRCLVLLGLVVMTLDPARAVAQPASTADKAHVAKQYVDAALAAQNTGDYDIAITLYEKAYQLVPHPVLLFNMVHRLRRDGCGCGRCRGLVDPADPQ